MLLLLSLTYAVGGPVAAQEARAKGESDLSSRQLVDKYLEAGPSEARENAFFAWSLYFANPLFASGFSRDCEVISMHVRPILNE